jgi:uncharacterized ferredoxin-like protein
MFRSYKLVLILITTFSASIMTSGCATESEKTVRNLNTNSKNFKSPECQNSIKDIGFHSDVKKAKTVAVPTALIISGGLLVIPAIVASAGLRALDRVDASNIASRCGGKPIDKETIKNNIAKEAIIDSVTVTPFF